jgi:hypothetical protein
MVEGRLLRKRRSTSFNHPVSNNVRRFQLGVPPKGNGEHMALPSEQRRDASATCGSID